MLKTRLPVDRFVNYLHRQLTYIFPDDCGPAQDELRPAFEDALVSYLKCCKGISRKYFVDENAVLLSHMNTDQYAMFLYLISRHLFLRERSDIAERIYALNKVLHAIDVFYTVVMPEKFMFSHCVGTVLGHANYGNFFRVGQNCTVGTEGGDSPKFGEGVALYKGAIVTGNAIIGNNVHISANSFVRRCRIPDNVVAFGAGDKLSHKPSRLSVKERFFYSGMSGPAVVGWHLAIDDRS